MPAPRWVLTPSHIMRTSSIVSGALAMVLAALSLAGLHGIRHRESSDFASVAYESPLEKISGDSIMSHVAALSGNKTRALASEGSRRAGLYIRDQLLRHGWNARLNTIEIARRTGTPMVVTNVEADYPAGGAAGAVLILCTHYDSRADDPGGHAPGADDNASGTAVLLEIARILPLVDNLEKRAGIRMVFFGGEEDSMLGSTAFVERFKDAGQRLIGAINIDMVGYDREGPKDFVIFTDVASSGLSRMLEVCAAAIPSVRCESTVTTIANSDHGPFWSHGLKAISIWEGYDHNPWYHSSLDTPDKLSAPFMVSIARALACAVHALVRDESGDSQKACP